MLKLYNSLTREKEVFKPLKKNNVSIYVCGITPYDTTHIGHAFTYVFFDVLIRYLALKGYKVKYTQNVTDIDDDILKKAKEEGKNWKILGDYWTDRYIQDMKSLNVLLPTNFVKATDSINKMIQIIISLLKKGLAYKRDGNIYFDVGKFKKYGRLSKFNRKQMILISKERGADPSDPFKKDPLDFVLWQKTKAGEPFWPFDSAQGKEKGRPGWHIECSAMADRFLGQRIDIHGGGKDLIFPHHESEIAESESYTGKAPFVRYWMHTGMVFCNGEKMSKSLGNLIMIKDLLKKYTPNAVRWTLLSHHYKQPWEYEEKELEYARNCINIVKKAVKQKNSSSKKIIGASYFNKFIKIMDDDVNTPRSLELVLKVAKRILKKNKKDEGTLILFLESITKTLGFKL
ncbi:MAG: cysteine--tRNA ligase [Candidatus Levybacteria bacterium RIFCSPLOWO2_01_FULL_38_21]|nr:MAG: cysteine--tRNA ligase [Candidatus Levybacteria bacterium RIFCSPLOWO2_01_FULL_38_21]